MNIITSMNIPPIGFKTIPSVMPEMPEQFSINDIEMLFSVSISNNSVELFFNKKVTDVFFIDKNKISDITKKLTLKLVEMGFIFDNIKIKLKNVLAVAIDIKDVNNIGINASNLIFSEEEINILLLFFQKELIKKDKLCSKH